MEAAVVVAGVVGVLLSAAPLSMAAPSSDSSSDSSHSYSRLSARSMMRPRGPVKRMGAAEAAEEVAGEAAAAAAARGL